MPETAADGDRPAAPHSVVLGLEYATTVRPIDAGSLPDTRSLAIGIHEIRAICRGTGEILGRFDFRGAIPLGVTPIYGLSVVEPWGAYNDGPRTALLLDMSRAAPAGLRIEIDHQVPSPWLDRVAVELSCGWAPGGCLEFCGGTQAIDFDTGSWPASLVHGAASGPDLSIIILNYNRYDLTIASCSAVLQYPPAQRFEIIVVDNGSDLDCFTALQDADLPVRLIRLAEARSFGEANTFAAEAAAGDAILFLNNDAFVRRDALTRLFRALHADATVGITGPVFAFPNNITQEVGGYVTVDLTTIRAGLNHGILEVENLAGRATVDYISAACLMIRRDDFLSVGGFDPLLEPAYYEDVDLCLRIAGRGKRVELVGQAVVLHVQNATSLSEAKRATTEQALQRGRETMTSRWSAWLADRRAENLPPARMFDAEMVKGLIQTSRDAAPYHVLIDEPLAGTVGSRGLVAAVAAISRIGPTVLRAPTAYSVSRLITLCARFGLEFGTLTTAATGDLPAAGLDTIVHYTTRLPLDAPPSGGRHVIYFAGVSGWDHGSLDGLRQRVQALRRYELIVVDSETAMRICLDQLRRLNAPFMPIEIIRPPTDLDPAKDAGPKQDTILALGPFSRTDGLDPRLFLLEAFRRLQNKPGLKQLCMVFAGDLGVSDWVEDLAVARAASRGVRVEFIVNPSCMQLGSAMRRAKICVSTIGLDSHQGDLNCADAGIGAQIAAAVAAGCIPVVHERGVGAEVCEMLGVGFRFSTEDDLVEAMTLALVEAGPDGTSASVRRSAGMFSRAVHQQAWRDLVAGTPPGVRSDLARATTFSRLRFSPARWPAIRPERRALVVAGMHRSGTSAMTRVLSLAGAALPRDLMPSAADNPTGFWESLAVAAFNDLALSSRGSAWDDVFALQGRQGLAAPDLVRRACGVVRNCYDDAPLIVVKDPRLSLLIPIWDTALQHEGYTPVYVIMVRDPREVAASLLRRNGFPRSKSLLLWISYMVAVERDTRGAPRCFVAYHDLLASADTALALIEPLLGGQSLRPTLQARVELERFIRPARHHVAEERLLGPFERLMPFYEALTGASDTPDGLQIAAAELERWMAELQQIMGPTLAWNREAVRLQERTLPGIEPEKRLGV